MKTIALTGNIASGKSTVAAIFRRLGVPVIEADTLVHEMQRAGEPVYHALVARFGTEILAPDDELNRHALRDIMLSDPRAKADLEAIVHPAVTARLHESFAQAAARNERVVIADIPLLFEAANPADYDGIILVDAPVAMRRHRLVAGRGLTPETADRLIASQLPLEQKRAQADWIITNDASLVTLAQQTESVWAAMTK